MAKAKLSILDQIHELILDAMNPEPEPGARPETLVYIRRRSEVGNDRYVPVMHNICCVCHQEVDLFSQGYALTRINGDSRFGYEPYHLGH